MIFLNNLLIMFVLLISSSYEINQGEKSSKKAKVEMIGKQIAAGKAFKAAKEKLSFDDESRS